jgi:hypothetical protein
MVGKTAELYDSLKADGFSDLPDYKTFEMALQDKGKREQLHTALSGLYADIPDFETFDTKLGSRYMTIPERVVDFGKGVGNAEVQAEKMVRK